MIARDASVDLLRTTIKQCNKRIDTWSQQVEELQSDIEKLNRWINFEQSDVDEANEMIAKMEGTANETAKY